MHIMNGLVFGYKINQYEWKMLKNTWGEDLLYDELNEHIYEFKDYVILGHGVIENANDSKGTAYGLDEINMVLLEKKTDIDETIEKIKDYMVFPHVYRLPQLWYIHLTELE